MLNSFNTWIYLVLISCLVLNGINCSMTRWLPDCGLGCLLRVCWLNDQPWWEVLPGNWFDKLGGLRNMLSLLPKHFSTSKSGWFYSGWVGGFIFFLTTSYSCHNQRATKRTKVLAWQVINKLGAFRSGLITDFAALVALCWLVGQLVVIEYFA